MKYPWLLFDIDGTLLNFDLAEAKALRSTFSQIGLPFEARYFDIYKNINGRLWELLEEGSVTSKELRILRFSRLLEAIELQQDPDDMADRYLDNLARQTIPMDGAQEVVFALSGHARMVLITNGLKDVQRPRLRRSTFAGFFEDIVISEEVGVAKPHPGIFEEAFRRMQHPAKEEVLIIGDSLSSDIQGGLDFGIDTCWLNVHGRPADPEIPSVYEIRRLTDLLPILLPS